MNTPTDIANDIRKLIASAEVVVTDLSGANPNVLYEHGLAHGLGKLVVQISSDDMAKLPFDISHQRIIKYENTKAGYAQLVEELAAALRSI